MRNGTGTKHYCPGKTGRIGEHSPGGCSQVSISTSVGTLYYCNKHEMPCRNGCEGKKHLKNKTGCQSCLSKEQADERRERKKAAEEKKKAKKNEEEDFLNPPEERKKK